jgi:hypothetical protein
MATQDEQGRYIQPEDSLAAAQIASAARTTTGTGTAFDTSNIDEITAALTVSAISGTPTLDVSLKTSADGVVFYSVGTFTQKTAITAAETKVFTGLGNTSRWDWTIGGGTPSLTFAIVATVERD